MNSCIICGKETKNKKYCSIDCKSKDMSKPKRNCLNCGKKVLRCEVKFCCHECYIEYKKKQYEKSIVYNNCIICGKKTKNEKYCSLQCCGKDPKRLEVAIKNLDNTNTHKWSDSEISFLKENYGAMNINDIANTLKLSKQSIIAYASKYGIKSKRKWTDEQIKYLQENSNVDINILSSFLNKSKSAISNMYAELNGFTTKDRCKIISPQQYILEYIKTLKVPYQEEVKIGIFTTDILVKNIDFEVQGTYWHVDKRFYDYNSLTKEQLKRIDKDKRKKEFFESLGIQIVYLWEYDIYSNPQKIKQQINNILGLPN